MGSVFFTFVLPVPIHFLVPRADDWVQLRIDGRDKRFSDWEVNARVYLFTGKSRQLEPIPFFFQPSRFFCPNPLFWFFSFTDFPFYSCFPMGEIYYWGLQAFGNDVPPSTLVRLVIPLKTGPGCQTYHVGLYGRSFWDMYVHPTHLSTLLSRAHIRKTWSCPQLFSYTSRSRPPPFPSPRSSRSTLNLCLAHYLGLLSWSDAPTLPLCLSLGPSARKPVFRHSNPSSCNHGRPPRGGAFP